MDDLRPYQLPLAPMPAEARKVREQGVLRAEFPALDGLRAMWLEGPNPYPDGVRRAADGKALITCTTEMPGVTPAMIDWWFGWHLPDSRRYRLWHPVAHLRARVREDRSHLSDDRARYVGNVSYVDEYIGKSRKRLAISFHDPAAIGLADVDARGGTVIYGRTADRLLSSEGGCLVHLVLPSAGGSVMRSAFWLGDLRSRLPRVGRHIDRLVNRPAFRQRVIDDAFLLDLFQHCSEEMNHLAKFLPRLHRDAHEGGAS